LKCSPQLRVETARAESASTCDSGCDASIPSTGSLPLCSDHAPPLTSLARSLAPALPPSLILPPLSSLGVSPPVPSLSPPISSPSPSFLYLSFSLYPFPFHPHSFPSFSPRSLQPGVIPRVPQPGRRVRARRTASATGGSAFGEGGGPAGEGGIASVARRRGGAAARGLGHGGVGAQEVGSMTGGRVGADYGRKDDYGRKMITREVRSCTISCSKQSPPQKTEDSPKWVPRRKKNFTEFCCMKKIEDGHESNCLLVYKRYARGAAPKSEATCLWCSMHFQVPSHVKQTRFKFSDFNSKLFFQFPTVQNL
jgi:hypothetical protein